MPLEDNKGKVSVSTLKEKRASVLVNNGIVTDLELNENSKRPVANAIITENLQMIADQVNENLENIDQLLEDTKSLLNDIADLKEALAIETNRAKQNELLLTNTLDEKDSDFENSLSTIRNSVNQN
jgi:ABC-type transporter Mla subunit MlaD